MDLIYIKRHNFTQKINMLHTIFMHPCPLLQSNEVTKQFRVLTYVTL